MGWYWAGGRSSNSIFYLLTQIIYSGLFIGPSSESMLLHFMEPHGLLSSWTLPVLLFLSGCDNWHHLVPLTVSRAQARSARRASIIVFDDGINLPKTVFVRSAAILRRRRRATMSSLGTSVVAISEHLLGGFTAVEVRTLIQFRCRPWVLLSAKRIGP